MATTRQNPIGSGFGAASTTTEILAGLDLSGQVAIVTGGYSGLGLATALALAAIGAEVIVPARDAAKARAALARHPKLALERLDLMDPASIDSFASRFLETGRPLHMLINSAGVMGPPLMRDSRGYECQFSTNHLGHFQLTARLWPALRRAKGARVVSISSLGHMVAPIDFDDPNFERRPYEPGAGYGQSKTANILFAMELDARGRDEGVRAFSVHPGMILTDLPRHMAPGQLEALGVVDEKGRPIIDPSRGLKTPEQGASTIVWCAASPRLEGMGGVYCEDCDIAIPTPAGAPPGSAGVRAWAVDPALAARLWTLSERLTGVPFPARGA
jgi:NAD(P)-dependent dehydrogenase (short-subunit alcohol dehydrogenase family)